MATLRSRLAPTPSGYLHLGNAVHFLLTWLLVRTANGVLRLRIDDADQSRCRPEYVEDIFRQLDWLGIDWDEGPSGPDELARAHSQTLRRKRYQEALAALGRQGLLYPCDCSRSRIRKLAIAGRYPGFCRNRTRPPAGAHAIRVRVPENITVPVEGQRLPLDRAMGDFVLWRRDNLPAYQLVSVVDDLDQRINLIVRGEDLKLSTAAQLFLAEHLGATTFAACRFLHHPLLTGPEGDKLSKSDRALSLAAMREQGVEPVAVYRRTASFLGLPAAAGDSLAGLRAAFEATGLLSRAAGAAPE